MTKDQLNKAAKALAEDLSALFVPLKFSGASEAHITTVILEHFTALTEGMEKRVKELESRLQCSDEVIELWEHTLANHSEDEGDDAPYYIMEKEFLRRDDELSALGAERDQLAGQLAEYKLVTERIGNALEGVMGWYGAICDCGHPACGKCRDTAEAKAALAAFYRAVGQQN